MKDESEIHDKHQSHRLSIWMMKTQIKNFFQISFWLLRVDKFTFIADTLKPPQVPAKLLLTKIPLKF